MEENQITEVSEKELAALLATMPDNVVVRVTFGKEEKDGEKN